MQRQHAIIAALTLAAAMLSAGCQQNDPSVANRTPTYATSGTVTYKGQPVAGAHVSFRPQGSGEAAFGRTDDAGKFTLRTYVEGDGAPAGAYLVTIEKMSTPAADQNKSGADLFAEMERKAQSGETAQEPQPTSLIPEKYRDPTTSGLDAEVKADGPNEFNFALED